MFLKYLADTYAATEILHDPLRIGETRRIRDWSLTTCGSYEQVHLQEIFSPELTTGSRASRWGFVYVVALLTGQYAGAYKIGHTYKNVYLRTSATGCEYKGKTERVWAIKTLGFGTPQCLERSLHFHFREKRVLRELFYLNHEEIEQIKTIPNGFDIANLEDKSIGRSWKQVAGLQDSKGNTIVIPKVEVAA